MHSFTVRMCRSCWTCIGKTAAHQLSKKTWCKNITRAKKTFRIWTHHLFISCRYLYIFRSPNCLPSFVPQFTGKTQCQDKLGAHLLEDGRKSHRILLEGRTMTLINCGAHADNLRMVNSWYSVMNVASGYMVIVLVSQALRGWEWKSVVSVIYVHFRIPKFVFLSQMPIKVLHLFGVLA